MKWDARGGGFLCVGRKDKPKKKKQNTVPRDYEARMKRDGSYEEVQK